jgi:Cysteine-rich secretory protein family
MVLLVAGGLALWVLAVVLVLAICRAAARADDNDARHRLIRAGRRGASASLAAAVVTLPALSDEASAGQAECANRDVQFQVAPPLVREALLCELDRVRAGHDARRLRPDPQLDLAAALHVADMLERRFFSHTSPGGGDLADRARRAGYAVRRCRWRVGEILAWGVGRRSTAAGTVRAWMDSSEHRRILLSHHYREVGLGMQAGTPLEALPSGVTVAAVLGGRRC